jgi:carbon storage regulator
MLVLTRRPGEQVRIGNEITCVVLQIRGNKVRIGIEAPKDVFVVRPEILESRSGRGDRMKQRNRSHAAAGS